jgi:uncharacterized protein involved in exopolysaccharide biosynthesis
MLERQGFQDNRSDENSGQSLSIAHIRDLLKRRSYHFAIPALLVLIVGSFIAVAWPARFLSQSKILISAQEIPSDLVRPTVATLASERIQIIEQRILTRDNLLAVAQKFQLKPDWQATLLGTETTDFIKDRIQIKPLELTLPGDRKAAIAFTVGFDYEKPEVAMRVANELVTMILNQDVRSRTEFASETTRFLEQEVKRLENEINLTDAQVVEFRDRKLGDVSADSESQDVKQLAALRAELLIKSATYSDTHPDILALKRKIAAFKKTTPAAASPDTSIKSDAKSDKGAVPPKDTGSITVADVATFDALELKRQTLRSELTSARQKLTAARLGENLERGQHSERLEVLEQATVPKKPTSPNRPRIFGITLVAALMAGGAMVFAAETLNPTIRHTSELYSVIDSHLIVSIPYISTLSEMRRRKNSIWLTVGILVTIILGAVIAGYFLLPPIDILFSKSVNYLFK